MSHLPGRSSILALYLPESCIDSSSSAEPSMKPHLSNMSPEHVFMALLAAVNVIAICVSLLAVLEIRAVCAQVKGRTRQQAQRQVYKQARKNARGQRRQRAGAGTQESQIPTPPTGRRLLLITPVWQRDTNQVPRRIECAAHDSSYTADAFSSTDHYPESSSSSSFS